MSFSSVAAIPDGTSDFGAEDGVLEASFSGGVISSGTSDFTGVNEVFDLSFTIVVIIRDEVVVIIVSGGLPGKSLDKVFVITGAEGELLKVLTSLSTVVVILDGIDDEVGDVALLLDASCTCFTLIPDGERGVCA